MTQNTEIALQKLDLLIQSKHLLKHDFYKAWSNGELSIDCLREYAKEYYHNVKAFPTYLSALHSHTECQSTRKVLLKNLIEEEAGSPNHPELWKSFAMHLGSGEQDLADHQPNCEILDLISTFREICLKGSVAEGIAALYAYESQIPEICVSKIDGLKKHYGMNNPKQWEYFSIHILADKEHAAEERALLKEHLTPAFSKCNSHEVNKAADAILNKLWNFLSGLCHKYEISCIT